MRLRLVSKRVWDAREWIEGHWFGDLVTSPNRQISTELYNVAAAYIIP
jgi:hypothetical protein